MAATGVATNKADLRDLDQSFFPVYSCDYHTIFG